MSDPQMSMAATAAVSPSDYLQPAAATTQDSQPSPLALLAATCSKIGPPAVEAAVTPPAPPQPTPRKLVPIKPAPLPLSPCKNSFSILSSKGNILQIQGSQLSTSYPGGQFVFAIQNPTLINKGSRSNASIQYQVPQIQGNSSQTIQVQPSLTNQIQVIPGTNQAITTPSTSGHKPVPIKPAPVQKSSTTTTPVQSGANVVKLTGGGSNMTLTLPLNNLVNTSDIGGPAQLLTESPPTPLSKTNKKARKKSLPVSQPSVAVAEQVETVLIETTADNIIQAGNNLLIVQSPGGGQPAVVQQVQVVPPKAEQQQVVQIPQQALRVVQAASATLPTVPQKPSQNFQIQTTEPTPTQVYIRTPSGEVQTVLVQDSPPATAATTSTVTCNSPALRAPHLSGTSKKHSAAILRKERPLPKIAPAGSIISLNAAQLAAAAQAMQTININGVQVQGVPVTITNTGGQQQLTVQNVSGNNLTISGLSPTQIHSFPVWRSPSAWRLPPAKSAFRTPKLPPKPQFFQRKTMELKNSQAYFRSKITKDTTLPVTLTEWKLFRAGEVANKKKRNLPPLVLKINDTFESKRGKKRVKLQPYTGKEAPSSKGETSGNESDAEYLPKNRHKRLAQLQPSSKRNPHYQTLERDLIELQEQQLFELFVVVSLQKKPAGYTPQVIQQFPSKGDHGYKQSKDTEERLKVIPRFCFPDSEDSAPTLELKSETFSFVLTGEDGSRWFGYCKKLLPEGRGKRLPEVYCMVSRLGCFNLFSKILDEVEKRREMSPALVYPFMRSVMEAPFPAPGRTITVKSYLPGAGDESIELCRPLDSRLEHVDFECLFKCLSVRHLIRVCASLLLERRVIFVANSLSTLSKCGHAVVATLYPFTWQHTYIPVLPVSMIDIVCSPTPFFIGILSCSLPHLQDLPIEEVLIVDLCADRFLQEVSDEDEILPPKLQAALVQILEDRDEVLAQEQQFSQEVTLSSLVSEAFVRFFVELVGHYSLNMTVTERGERVFQREPFRKSHTSRSVRHFLDLFMETQMFAGFVQDRELRQSGVKGLFEVRALQYLETIPESEPSGVNRILRSLGSKMKFLHKK